MPSLHMEVNMVIYRGYNGMQYYLSIKTEKTHRASIENGYKHVHFLISRYIKGGEHCCGEAPKNILLERRRK